MGKEHKDLFGTKEAALKVILRVRPFNTREKDAKSVSCVSIVDNGHSIVLEGDKNNRKERKRQFTYDRVLDENCTQDILFQSGPQSIIEQVMQGYNGTIFVYGQTGSGKTYTMYGVKESLGIIYLAADYIAEIISQCTSQINYKISLSLLEIYNETLNDLLVEEKDKKHAKKLKIREDPLVGVYVDNLKRIDIDLHNKQLLIKLIDDAQGRRALAATAMNAVSSRSHAVLGLHIWQELTTDDTGFSDKKSALYMIDLAGSERAGAMQKGKGMTAKAFKEGTNINLSLSSLGMVIKALVDGTHVPYRNSILTRILKDSLGGNSMTNMIANLSPAQINFAETLSTLQYADRAKSIKNKVNQFKDAKSAKIAELEAEIAHLIKELENFQARCSCGITQKTEKTAAKDDRKDDKKFGDDNEVKPHTHAQVVTDLMKRRESSVANMSASVQAAVAILAFKKHHRNKNKGLRRSSAQLSIISLNRTHEELTEQFVKRESQSMLMKKYSMFSTASDYGVDGSVSGSIKLSESGSLSGSVQSSLSMVIQSSAVMSVHSERSIVAEVHEVKHRSHAPHHRSSHKSHAKHMHKRRVSEQRMEISQAQKKSIWNKIWLRLFLIVLVVIFAVVALVLLFKISEIRDDAEDLTFKIFMISKDRNSYSYCTDMLKFNSQIQIGN